jgi:hypothetical protein
MAYISNYRVHPGRNLPKKEILMGPTIPKKEVFDGLHKQCGKSFWNGISKKGNI